MVTPDKETGENSSRTKIPEIGTEVWGRPKPTTVVPGAKWIKIGFGRDTYRPQLHTGWKLIAEVPVKQIHNDQIEEPAWRKAIDSDDIKEDLAREDLNRVRRVKQRLSQGKGLVAKPDEV
jgi:hypothetical protein